MIKAKAKITRFHVVFTSASRKNSNERKSCEIATLFFPDFEYFCWCDNDILHFPPMRYFTNNVILAEKRKNYVLPPSNPFRTTITKKYSNATQRIHVLSSTLLYKDSLSKSESS